MLAWACGPATEQCTQEDDGVDKTRSVSFAHQKSNIFGDAVSPPYCASCPLAWTAVLVEGGGLAVLGTVRIGIQNSILESHD